MKMNLKDVKLFCSTINAIEQLFSGNSLYGDKQNLEKTVEWNLLVLIKKLTLKEVASIYLNFYWSDIQKRILQAVYRSGGSKRVFRLLKYLPKKKLLAIKADLLVIFKDNIDSHAIKNIAYELLSTGVRCPSNHYLWQDIEHEWWLISKNLDLEFKIEVANYLTSYKGKTIVYCRMVKDKIVSELAENNSLDRTNLKKQLVNKINNYIEHRRRPRNDYGGGGIH